MGTIGEILMRGEALGNCKSGASEAGNKRDSACCKDESVGVV